MGPGEATAPLDEDHLQTRHDGRCAAEGAYDNHTVSARMQPCDAVKWRRGTGDGGTESRW